MAYNYETNSHTESCPACKYVIESKKDPENVYRDLRLQGDEEFINIEGSFHIEAEAGYGGTYTKKVSLYACPKCGTVKMKDNC